MSRRDEILSQVSSVPSLPAVVCQLQQYLDDPEVNFSKLARVIECDPGLTANVLQLANSAYFGWQGGIASVRDAISRLGTKRIFQMVLCMSVAPLVRKPIRGYELEAEKLWEHCVAVAIGAEKIAARRRPKVQSSAFTAGLLHDVGKVVLGTFVEIDDEPIKELVESDGLTFNEAERMVLGVDHAEVGAHLLEHWNLPADVAASTRWHHEPERADVDWRDLVDVIHVTDVICMNCGWGLGRDGLQYRLDEDAASRLKLKSGDAQEAAAQVMIGLEELLTVLTPNMEGERDGVQHPAR
ncbi:HDOD domain-containing protein [bacterium]|nr:HDOD domain-containing protein [bacterium]